MGGSAHYPLGIVDCLHCTGWLGGRVEREGGIDGGLRDLFMTSYMQAIGSHVIQYYTDHTVSLLHTEVE